MEIFFENIKEVIYTDQKIPDCCQGICVNISGMRYPGGFSSTHKAGVILLHLHNP